jgi:hypothetical protein
MTVPGKGEKQNEQKKEIDMRGNGISVALHIQIQHRIQCVEKR